MIVDSEIKEQFDTLPEINCYFLITEIGNHLKGMHQKHKEGKIPSDVFKTFIEKRAPQLQNTLVYGVSALSRFGVEQPHELGGRATPEYWAWFEWWNTYIQGLPQHEWDQMQEAISRKEDATHWRPSGDWRPNVERIREEQLEQAIKINNFKKGLG